MRKIQATYLFPINTPPIPNGIIVVNNEGTILEITSDSTYDSDEIIKYEGIICPGFINAHCHLELSHLKGILPEKQGLVEFLKSISQIRDTFDEQIIVDAIEKSEREMYHNGIIAIGDICNGTRTIPQKLSSLIQYHNFIEIFGLPPKLATTSINAGSVIYQEFTKQLKNHTTSISPHAPYTASANLLQKIDTFNKENAVKPLLSIHNQESNAENELFQNGTGDFADLYRQIPHIPDLSTFFKVPNCTSVEYVTANLSESCKTLLVHNTYSNLKDIQVAHTRNKANVYWCFCPNANLYIENSLPNFGLFMAEDAQIVVGTDSLASNWQLCILSELKTIHKFASNIPLTDLLQWATLNGAKFFGWDTHLGSLEIGKQPTLNLIQNINLKNLTLTEKSFVKRLI